jgi:hypothetical protein
LPFKRNLQRYTAASHPAARGTLWSRDGGALEAPLADLATEVGLCTLE